MEPDGPDRIMLRTYLLDSSKQRLARIDVGVRLVSSLSDIGELAIKEVSDEDWQNAWKAHFNLMKIGRRLVIQPTWIDYQPEPGEAVIEIDPGNLVARDHDVVDSDPLQVENAEQHALAIQRQVGAGFAYDAA